ncbi:MAG: SDR family NAD(P)-dependent oxidoreductase [Acidobacteriota bacterium]
MLGSFLEGRVALVTGAAQGMGAACARRLAEQGARLVVFDIQRPALEQRAEALRGAGVAVETVPGDVTRSADAEEAARRAVERFGSLDILVNAAGILRPTGIFELSEDEWDWVVSVSLKGSFLMSRAVVRPMRAQGWGRIVHFSSTAGKTVSTLGGCHYTAAKHGVLGLTRALARELAPFGITVNAVCPGLIDTEMVRQSISEEETRKVTSTFPIARLGTPGEVADLVCFLASPQAGYITGAAVDINGGDLMV